MLLELLVIVKELFRDSKESLLFSGPASKPEAFKLTVFAAGFFPKSMYGTPSADIWIFSGFAILVIVGCAFSELEIVAVVVSESAAPVVALVAESVADWDLLACGASVAAAVSVVAVDESVVVEGELEVVWVAAELVELAELVADEL